ncbi:hypothetical protein [uncultured Aquimarina sp.]|uniref:hypothetical protein n=1 Tax=uncultured Aquimarina sp. TaxID=575652 RepID=UPI0026090935|nr:hypothetical protein [uncultured Aquimarina sp.]
MSEEKKCFEPAYGDISLHIDPNPKLSSKNAKAYQVLHLESLFGSNIAILAHFECGPINNGCLQLKKGFFTMYPMLGVLNFGFREVGISNDGNFEFALGIIDNDGVCESIEVDFTKNNQIVTWETKKIIKNEITFRIGNISMDRDTFVKYMEGLNIYRKGKEDMIPRNGRPCQFKLVTEL